MGDALASVAGNRIGRADFEAELKRRARGLPGAFTRADQREALLGEMIDFEAVYLRAREAGFDQKPEIAGQIKRLIVSQFIETQLSAANHPAEVTETEVEKFYENHRAKYAMPEQARFAVVFFGFSPKATDEKKEAIRAKASDALVEARGLPASEKGFGLIAQKHSKDAATRYAGGDAGWISRGIGSRWNAKITEAVFALKNQGEIAPLITVSNGCYLVKLMDRKEAGSRGLVEVEEAIRYQLGKQKQQQAQQSFYESMKAGLPIEINRPLLESIAPPPEAETKPPGVPAG